MWSYVGFCVGERKGWRIGVGFFDYREFEFKVGDFIL